MTRPPGELRSSIAATPRRWRRRIVARALRRPPAPLVAAGARGRNAPSLCNPRAVRHAGGRQRDTDVVGSGEDSARGHFLGHSPPRRDPRRGAQDAGIGRAVRDRGAHPRPRQDPPRRRPFRGRRAGKRGRGAVDRLGARHRLGLRRVLRPRQPGRGGTSGPRAASARARPPSRAHRRVRGGGRRPPRVSRGDARGDGVAPRGSPCRARADRASHGGEAPDGALEAPARRLRAAPALRPGPPAPRARGGDRRTRGRGHRALADGSRPHRQADGDRRGAHGPLLPGRRLLGGAARHRRRPGRRPGRALPGPSGPARMAHGGVVDRRRPRRQPVGRVPGHRRDLAPSPRARHRAPSAHAPGARPPAQREQPPATSAARPRGLARRQTSPSLPRGLSRRALRPRAAPADPLAPRRRSRGGVGRGHDGAAAGRRAPPRTGERRGDPRRARHGGRRRPARARRRPSEDRARPARHVRPSRREPGRPPGCRAPHRGSRRDPRRPRHRHAVRVARRRGPHRRPPRPACRAGARRGRTGARRRGHGGGGRDVEALPPHRAHPLRVRARRALRLRHLDGPERGRRPVGPAPGPLGGRRGRPGHRAAVRDPRRPRRRAAHPGRALLASRLRRPSRRVRRETRWS